MMHNNRYSKDGNVQQTIIEVNKYLGHTYEMGNKFYIPRPATLDGVTTGIKAVMVKNHSLVQADNPNFKNNIYVPHNNITK